MKLPQEWLWIAVGARGIYSAALHEEHMAKGLDALLPMRRNDAHRGRVRRYSRARHRGATKAAYDRLRALEGAALTFRDESLPRLFHETIKSVAWMCGKGPSICGPFLKPARQDLSPRPPGPQREKPRCAPLRSGALARYARVRSATADG
jgi:hypothetical protein